MFFIIDQSASLKNDQQALIKDRLMGTINDFGPGEKFEVAFFSGPTWVLGEDPALIKEHWTWQNGSRIVSTSSQTTRVSMPTGGLPRRSWQKNI